MLSSTAVSIRSTGSFAEMITHKCKVEFSQLTEVTGFTMYGSIATVAKAAGFSCALLNVNPAALRSI